MVEGRDGSESFSSASQLLRHFDASAANGSSLRQNLDLLRQVGHLSPSIHDDRLRRLAHEVIARRDELSLTALVEASQALQTLGLRQELGPLVSMVTESASFLSSDVILSFARTLATTRQQGAFEVVDEAHVFRLLGEHVCESMFQSDPQELADALLAVSTFCCSRNSSLPDEALAEPWHHEVFSSALVPLTLQAPALRGEVLVKVLRAMSLYLSACHRAALGGAPPLLAATSLPSSKAATFEDLLVVLVDSLRTRLPELKAHRVVRALHSLYCLEVQGLLPEGLFAKLRAAAAQDLRTRTMELSVRDISYALEALGGEPAEDLNSVIPMLLDEVLQHVLAMTPEDALRLLKAMGKFPRALRPTEAESVIIAEVMRELRALAPRQLCDVVDAFRRLRLQEPAILESLGEAFASHVERFTPEQLATCLHGLVAQGVRDPPIFLAAAPKIVQDFVGFSHRDFCLCMWAFAKASHKEGPLIKRLEMFYKESKNSRQLTPSDVSMLLWSFSRFAWELPPEVLGRFTHHAALECQSYSGTALLVTCLSLARLGFRETAVLSTIYRSFYPRLPALADSQFAFVFVLFSGSGVRDGPLLQRLLHETKQRLSGLQGYDLANVVMACFRSGTSASLRDVEGLHDALRDAALENAASMPIKPCLRVFLAAPTLFDLTEVQTMALADAVAADIPAMDTAELTRCIVACARSHLVHEPFLRPVFQAIREKREELSPNDVLACCWAISAMGFYTPKFRRSLGFMLMAHVKAWRIPASRLRDLLPALNELGYWQRLPGSLQRAVWRIAGEDLRRGVPTPPSAMEGASPEEKRRATEEALPWKSSWKLPSIQPGLLRRRHGQESRMVSRSQEIQSLEVDPWQGRRNRRKQEQELENKREDQVEEVAEAAGTQPPTPVESFVRLVRRL